MARSLGAAWPGGEAVTPKRSAFFSPGPLALRVPLPSRLSADHARWMEIPLRFWRLQGQVCPTVSENHEYCIFLYPLGAKKLGEISGSQLLQLYVPMLKFREST